MTEAAGAPPVRQLGIDAFWEHRGSARAHRILPDGCMDFLFDLSTGASRVIGAMSTARVVAVPDGAHVFGVRFRPGSAVRYLDEHAGAFLDAAPELSLFRRGAFARLAPELADARDLEQRSAIVTRALNAPGLRRRAPDPRVRRAVSLVEASRGTSTMRSVAHDVGLGERQLERLFVEQVGHGPKLFARIVRLRHAIGLASRARLRQAELAVSAGFSDEPHLLRECRTIARATLRTLTLERDVGFVQVEPAEPA
jgi:AraC-like DNA-binding protein